MCHGLWATEREAEIKQVFKHLQHHDTFCMLLVFSDSLIALYGSVIFNQQSPCDQYIADKLVNASSEQESPTYSEARASFQVSS